MLLVVALVALCYFGGNYCPAVLRKNKEMLLGVVVGLALCSFMGMRMEGFATADECAAQCTGGIFKEGRGGTGERQADELCQEAFSRVQRVGDEDDQRCEMTLAPVRTPYINLTGHPARLPDGGRGCAAAPLRPRAGLRCYQAGPSRGRDRRAHDEGVSRRGASPRGFCRS